MDHDGSFPNWEMEAKGAFFNFEDNKQEQERFDVEDILDMDFFKEEEETMNDYIQNNESGATTVGIPLPQTTKKPKISISPNNNQVFTYPRAAKKKPFNFSTYRESSNSPPPKPTKRNFWYNNRAPKPDTVQASAPTASQVPPTEIVVTFPLLNIKATTSLLPSKSTFTTEPNIKQEKELFTPPASYYFDPRTQPFYYPSVQTYQPLVKQEPKEMPQVVRFVLLEQPSSRQRKSYKNENRYIVPNPLTICAKNMSPDLPSILRGVVTVKLVDKEGNPILSEKGNILESVDGSLSQPLYGPNLSTDFSLKVLQTSQGNMFRLLFVVSYVAEGFGNCEEKIYSRPFVVHSNRRKNTKEKPIVLEMKSTIGPSSGCIEVWVKGIGFSEKVNVIFGDQPAAILESSENLLVVAVPPVHEEDKTVKVTVSNVYHQNDLRTADRVLVYSYRSNNFEGMETEDNSQLNSILRQQFLPENL